MSLGIYLVMLFFIWVYIIIFYTVFAYNFGIDRLDEFESLDKYFVLVIFMLTIITLPYIFLNYNIDELRFI